MRQSTPDHQLLLFPTIDLFSSVKQGGIRLSSAEKREFPSIRTTGRKVDFRPTKSFISYRKRLEAIYSSLVGDRKEDVVRSFKKIINPSQVVLLIQ